MITVVIVSVLLLWVLAAVYGATKPLPAGVSMAGPARALADADIEFLYDLTFVRGGDVVHEQSIFDRTIDIIGAARDFIVIDVFLINDEYDRRQTFPALSARLVEALVQKRRQQPQLPITLISDEINTFYGAYRDRGIERLKEHGIEVVFADMAALRDSNPAYSGLWRLLGRWYAGRGRGWLPHPFSRTGPRVTVNSYLKLLNFKANHRKLVVTEQTALITSANPHDASAWHSNIAFVLKGDIIGDLLAAEQAVVRFSGGTAPGGYPGHVGGGRRHGVMEARLLTEGKIKKHLLAAINSCLAGDTVQMAMFYLSDREVIGALLAAAARGAEVRLVLDANKDAFGRRKQGMPNRPVASELVRKSGGGIRVRWYETHGEQFHAKLVMVSRGQQCEIFAGSANLTRRNINDFNLEADVQIAAPAQARVAQEVNDYFTRLWNNTGGAYTAGFEKYARASPLKTLLYRIQEWSGICTY